MKLPALLQLGDSDEAAKHLLALVGMINQAVGDALSGILLVEAALRRRSWGLSDWAKLYTDLPSRQLKVSCHSHAPVTALCLLSDLSCVYNGQCTSRCKFCSMLHLGDRHIYKIT